MIWRLWWVAVWCVAIAACSPLRDQTPPAAIATAAPTAVPTPTLMPPLYETFNSATEQAIRAGSVANARFAVENGRYTVTVSDTNTLVWSSVGGVFADGGAEAEIFFAAGTPTTAAGLLFRLQDERNFYMASLSSDGFYALDARENGNWRSIIEWTRWSTIDTRGKANRFRVQAAGNSISLLLNGVLLAQTVDSAFASGSVALAVNTYENANVSVQFDAVKLEPVAPAAQPKE